MDDIKKEIAVIEGMLRAANLSELSAFLLALQLAQLKALLKQ